MAWPRAWRTRDPLERVLGRPAWRGAAAATGGIAFAALAAGTVRLLPWVLDPRVPWSVAAPFARGLMSVAFESALLVGWPLGWAFACARIVESGEARVFQVLGEAPARTVTRLAPQAAVLAALLALAALVWGRDAAEPGRVATELIAQARASCLAADEPTTYAVPFTDLTWLCPGPNVAGQGFRARLVGRAPAAFSGATFTAADALIGDDFRRIELSDARLVLTTPNAEHSMLGGALEVHVGALTLRGLAPWARASSLPAPLRALLFAATAAGCAALSAWSFLRPRSGTKRSGVRPRTRLAALVLGAAGPVAALAYVRLADRAEWPTLTYVVTPIVAWGVALGVAEVVARLPLLEAAASTYRTKKRATPWGTSASPRS